MTTVKKGQWLVKAGGVGKKIPLLAWEVLVEPYVGLNLGGYIDGEFYRETFLLMDVFRKAVADGDLVVLDRCPWAEADNA